MKDTILSSLLRDREPRLTSSPACYESVGTGQIFGQQFIINMLAAAKISSLYLTDAGQEIVSLSVGQYKVKRFP